MKRSSASFLPILLGLVCAVFLVSGCALFEQQANDSLIKFSAASSLQTKVHYGDIDYSGNTPNIQMIWDNGDVIRIVSDHARTASNADFYDYPLVHDREEGSHSFAKFVQSENQSGLRWEEGGNYNFYAAFPAVNMASDGSFSASLPSDEYLMVAHTSTSYDPAKKVFLSFYPAFTAVEITILNDNSDVTITDCALSSSSTALVGDFTATIGNSRLSNINIRSGVFYADPVSSLTESLSYGGKRFTFFCLPQNLYNLELTCFYSKNGTTFYKTIALKESGSNLMFEACKYHRLSLVLDSSGGSGGGDYELTLGGSQLLLVTLRNNYTKVVSGLKAYYGIGEGPAWQYPNGAQFEAMLQSVRDKVSTNGDQFIKDHFWEADKVFNGTASFSFTSDELQILSEAVLPLITDTGTIGQEQYTKITADIIATDFTWLPNLQSISHLETDQNLSPRPSISIENLSSLNNVNLNQYTFVNIDGCGGSSGVSVHMSNANNVAGELVLKNMKVNGQLNIGNQHMIGPVIVENVTGMSSMSVGNLTSAQISNCPDLQTINLSTARNLTDFSVEDCEYLRYFTISNAGSSFQRISLKNTPKLERGEAGNNMSNFTVLLRDCSYEVSGTPYIQLNNTQVGSVTVSKDTRSAHVEVRCQDGTL